MTARNICLTLEYDGTHFFGFQKQPGKRTVQSEIEKALFRIFRKRMKISSASGRTDAGVHAEYQIVNFKTESAIPLRNIQRALNTYFPKDMSAVHIREVPTDFSARFSAKSKTYEYCVWNQTSRSPLRSRFSYHVPFGLNISAMKKATSCLKGRHDFRSFQSKPGGRSSMRRIFKFGISKKGGEIRFRVEGDGFLYNMVRNLVGTLLMVGTGKLSPADFQKILKAKDRRHIGPTAPAQGLALSRVKY